MRRLARLLGAVTLVATAAFATAGVAGAQEPGSIEIMSVDTAAYPSVTAVVAAPAGLAGAGYPASAFTVLEEGTEVPFTVARVPTTDLEILLLVDTSGSMEGPAIAAAKTAATEFLTVLPPDVKVGAISFGTQPVVAAAPTTDRQLVATKIAALVADGDTALYDAVVFAGQQFTPAARDRAIVLLSDGGDTASQATLPAAIAAAAGLRLHAIELVTADSNRAALDQLAAGGGVTSATDPAALGALYRAAASTLANQYRIEYTASHEGDAQLTVRLATAQGVLEDTAIVQPPAGASAPPTTSAPAPATTTGTVEARVSPSVEPSIRMLVIGGVAFFGCLLLLGLSAIPGDGRAQRVRAHLGLGRVAAEGQSVAHLKDRMADRVEGMLEQRGRRRSLALALEVAGVSLRPGEFVLLVALATLVGALAGLALLDVVGLILALVLVPLTARAIVGRRAEQRRAAFADLLPDNIQLLTSSVRSGYGVLQALDNVAQEASEPARTEFRRVLLETRVGRDPASALHALADRMQSADFEWVVGAIDINREVGGDLAMVLDNVADTIRERQRLFRQMRALTAEGRISAYILTALPVVLALLLAAINPDYVKALTSGPGLIMTGIGAGLLLIGWIWMKRQIRLEY